MGAKCCGASAKVEPTLGEQTSNVVEEALLRAKLESLYTFKILLLGAGESGKSTIVKQFRLIHNRKLSKQEYETISDSLHQNVIDCIRALLQAANKFGHGLDDDTDRRTAETVAKYEENTRLTPEMGTAILRLYRSEAIRRTYARRSEFWILDSCDYYFENLERFCSSDFTPSEEDALLARIRTTGIVETWLDHKIAQPKAGEPDTVKFLVVDVGGQRNERKKWIHCFAEVKAILFIVNLNAYNQVLFEDNTKNRMIESLELFYEITHNKLFVDTPIVLFFNKKDLFEREIAKVDLKDVLDSKKEQLFPDYNGGPNALAGIEYLTHLFKQQLPADKDVDVQVVTGVVRKEIRAAFEDVKRALMELNRKKIDREKATVKRDLNAVRSGNNNAGGVTCGGCMCACGTCDCSC